MTDSQELARLDDLIACGWGDVPQVEIPTNWRDVPGPGRLEGPEDAKMGVGANLGTETHSGARKRGIRGIRGRRGSLKTERLLAIAARMRARRFGPGCGSGRKPDGLVA